MVRGTSADIRGDIEDRTRQSQASVAEARSSIHSECTEGLKTFYVSDYGEAATRQR